VTRRTFSPSLRCACGFADLRGPARVAALQPCFLDAPAPAECWFACSARAHPALWMSAALSPSPSPLFLRRLPVNAHPLFLATSWLNAARARSSPQVVEVVKEVPVIKEVIKEARAPSGAHSR
jgi:hypothetical protein